jgi:hypothetical protein
VSALGCSLVLRVQRGEPIGCASGSGAGSQIYSRQIVCSSSGDQNLSRDRHILHRQPAYCSVAFVRTGCHTGTWRHQHSGDGAAHSSGKEQLAHCISKG